ncbi:MAG: mechanosensitive ion channel family protein [Phormidesmis sp.]
MIHPIVALLILSVANSALSRKAYYLPEPWNDKLAHAFIIAIILVVGWTIQRALYTTKRLILRQYNTNQPDNLHARRVHTQVDVIAKIISFFIVVLTLAAISLTFEGATVIGQSLLASAGVASIILGLAAQKTIGNLFAGIQIAITQPIRLEDAVFIEGEWGWIEEINLTYVVIRIWDLRRLVVPITYFSDKPFQNWTRNSAEIIGTVVVYTDYTVPVEAIRSELNGILDQTPLWNKNVRVLQVIDCQETTLQLRALMTGKDAPTTWDLRCHVREKLVAWLAQAHPQALPHTRVELEPVGKD